MTAPLFELQPRRVTIADTSREAFNRIKPTLAEREWNVFVALHELCRRHGDATGGELATFMGLPVTSVRPRLTGLLEKRLVESLSIRASRARGEMRCHPFRPLMPIAAVERAREKSL